MFSDDGLVAVGKLFDEFRSGSGPCGGFDFLLSGAGASEGDIGGDGIGEQEAVLEDDS